jgi:hypothetical protein
MLHEAKASQSDAQPVAHGEIMLAERQGNGG